MASSRSGAAADQRQQQQNQPPATPAARTASPGGFLLGALGGLWRSRNSAGGRAASTPAAAGTPVAGPSAGALQAPATTAAGGVQRPASQAAAVSVGKAAAPTPSRSWGWALERAPTPQRTAAAVQLQQPPAATTAAAAGTAWPLTAHAPNQQAAPLQMPAVPAVDAQRMADRAAAGGELPLLGAGWEDDTDSTAGGGPLHGLRNSSRSEAAWAPAAGVVAMPEQVVQQQMHNNSPTSTPPSPEWCWSGSHQPLETFDRSPSPALSQGDQSAGSSPAAALPPAAGAVMADADYGLPWQGLQPLLSGGEGGSAAAEVVAPPASAAGVLEEPAAEAAVSAGTQQTTDPQPSPHCAAAAAGAGQQDKAAAAEETTEDEGVAVVVATLEAGSVPVERKGFRGDGDDEETGEQGAAAAPASAPGVLGKRAREVMERECGGWSDSAAVARRRKMLEILRWGGGMRAALAAWRGDGEPAARAPAPGFEMACTYLGLHLA
jgi:hypothetical protein